MDRHSDKFEKLLKYDKGTFEECFVHGSSKMVTPLINTSDFKNNKFDDREKTDPMIETMKKFS